MTYKFTLVNDEGIESDVIVPGRYEVCGRCQGRGVHDHPAFANGLTQEDFDDDPDFREDYFRGRYDVRCSECKGERVVMVPDENRCTPEQRSLLEEHWVEQAREAQWKREEETERRMGA